MNLAHSLRSLAVAAMLALGSLGLSGCEDDGKDPGTSGAGLIQVTGTVTELNDQTPVDGGVTIQVNDAKRGNVTLTFESLFTHPAPTPERQALYQEIQKVSVGNTIQATARAEGSTNFRLESIKVITPQ